MSSVKNANWLLNNVRFGFVEPLEYKDYEEIKIQEELSHMPTKLAGNSGGRWVLFSNDD